MDSYRRILPHSTIELPLAELVPVPQEPREPYIFWLVFIFLGLPLYIFVSESIFFAHHTAQMMLATPWLVMGIGLHKRSILPAALCFFSFLVLGGARGIYGVSIAIVSFALPWVILRVCRLLALDWQRLGPDGTLITPRLADRAQFSLRTVIVVFIVAALISVCFVAFKQYRGLEILELLLGLYIPLQVLMLLGMLSRVAWYWRCMMLSLVPLGLMGFTLVTTNFRNAAEAWIMLVMPGSQIIVLIVLRGAGYRLGMPRSPEESLETKQPQSPWD